ncbi:MAG: 2-C-methyl-D-erythritol 2,4-cyclodiphosphate synthase [Candidatus Brocadiia bacterium]
MDGQVDRLRVGIGCDTHRLEKNSRRLILGGVEIAHPAGYGPVAHSDGDAVLHAVIDSLLGAAGLGDIGELFPDSDPRYADADSTDLLAIALGQCGNLSILSLDMVVTCDHPKISPHKNAMKKRLAELLRVPPERINLKGKTWEGTLSGVEAVSVHAIVLAQVVC